MTAANVITSTTTYPVYATKAAFLTDLRQHIEVRAGNDRKLLEILYRLSNTDTDNWTAASTARHDD